MVSYNQNIDYCNTSQASKDEYIFRGVCAGCAVSRFLPLVMKFITLAHRILKIGWRITKPVTQGARVLIVKQGRVLLVKHAYQDHYFLPGGMLRKGETFEQAAKRELMEEVGIELGELKLFGVYNNFYEHKNDGIVVFLCESYLASHRSDREIESFDFFPLDKLPPNVSSGTKRRINEYITNSFPTYGLW